MNLLKAKDENSETLKEEMQTLSSLLVPFLEEIHSILVSFYLCHSCMIDAFTHFSSIIFILFLKIFQRLHGLDTLKSK